MQLSSPRFKSIAVTAGLTFWFIILTSTTGYFSYESLLIFSLSILAMTQIFAYKVSKGLDKFAILNTAVFLGLLFNLLLSAKKVILFTFSRYFVFS